jgi:hypothetical protein
MMRDNSLRRFGLGLNPALEGHMKYDPVSKSIVVTKDPKEKVALLTIIDVFGISSPDLSLNQKYEPDVEHVNRRYKQ